MQKYLSYRFYLIIPVSSLILSCSASHDPKSNRAIFHKDIVDRRPITNDELKKAHNIGTPEELAKSGLWFVYDSKLDGVEGVGSEKSYAELNLDQRNAPVIVAVVDSGVDIEHEDLQGHIWINEKEASGQPGIDDDNNGYIDDLHGWNFIGGVDDKGDPTHLSEETLEVTRITKKLTDKKNSGVELTIEEAALLKQTSEEVEEERKSANETLIRNQKAYEDLKLPYEVIKNLVAVAIDALTIDNVKAVESKDEAVNAAKEQILKIFESVEAKSTARILRMIQRSEESLNYYYNLDFNPRALIVKDNPEDINDVHYGNNSVTGPDADHGTHVAGIIAALRNNDKGVNGIAENVRIMVLRAVPNGDERDKDVALAIRYAVNNGAKIVNMSFGKSYSPQKQFVDEAMKYAAGKGVLLVHSAGNDSSNNDGKKTYPNRELNEPDERGNNEISTWVEVGASSAMKGDKLPAAFSNYGRRIVDVFAPGFEISSSVPGNKYAIFSGTSMAAPSVSGVAALVLSQHFNLTGPELKDFVLSSSRRHPGLKVILPGTKDFMVPFSELSRTGGIGDVFLALKNLLSLASNK